MKFQLGLGLGLSISKALTELMHGTIVAQSEGKNMGTTIKMTFPTSSREPSPILVPSKSESFEMPQRILLVEDNKSTALVMKRFLSNLGHDVKVAYCVKEAMDLAHENTFDLIVSDVGLPDGTGFDLMKTLHSIYGLRGICVSGYGMPEDILQSKKCGFDIHVTKPVELQTLKSAISHVVKLIVNKL